MYRHFGDMYEPMDADVLLICVDHVYMIYIYMVVVVNIYMIGFYMYLIHKPLAREATSFSYCTAHIKFHLFHQGDHYFLAIVVCIAHRFQFVFKTETPFSLP